MGVERNNTDGNRVVHWRPQLCHKAKEDSCKEIIEEINRNPGSTAGQIVASKIQTSLQQDEIDWDNISSIADMFVDNKRVNQLKSAEEIRKNPSGHSFDAVTYLKAKTDKQDPFLIYKINNVNQNNGQMTFIFKSSKDMANWALKMDKDEGEIANVYAHVDAKHDRTRGMKTITSWFFNPQEKRVMRLAVMDADAENSDSLTLFWKTFNEMLSEQAGVDYKFNPKGFVVDENPANWIALENVFGQEVLERTVSCEFHLNKACKSIQRNTVTLRDLLN